MMMNHYLLLGLQPDAEAGQIKTAYRRMAKRFHPDTNQGSEAAAELFRQLNEAYRVLTDPGLRTAYDAKLVAAEQAAQLRKRPQQKGSQAAAQTQQSPREPKQKFNRFLNTLLDALLEEPESAAPPAAARDRPAAKKPPTNLRQQPDFDFYYYLAKEKKTPAYACGSDGVYRRTKSTKSQRVNHAAAGFSRVPGSGLLIILLSSLWGVFNP